MEINQHKQQVGRSSSHLVTRVPVADPGEGPRSPGHPLIFRPNFFLFLRPPPHPTPPFICRSGSATQLYTVSDTGKPDIIVFPISVYFCLFDLLAVCSRRKHVVVQVIIKS